jgi:glyoxylase-like metal-dependent hydrolase (beta-lactamase superfamily II)
MAHLPGGIDGIVNFDRLTITILFLPGHTKGRSLFTDCHFASFRVTGSKK